MPRRVVCTGYCTGGALAGIAAVWAGHNWPDSDVRCITFGAPQCAPEAVYMPKENPSICACSDVRARLRLLSSSASLLLLRGALHCCSAHCIARLCL